VEHARRPDVERDPDRWLEEHRAEIARHCRRFLRSAFDADDAAQETLVRAWRAFDAYEGRGSRNAWLRRIATNVCLDMLEASHRRAVPLDSVSLQLQHRPPLPGARARAGSDDPADQAVERETIGRAFVAAAVHLPPRQRAVLILCEVLRWRVAEVAELLNTTVAAVNSALQRARAGLARGDRRGDRERRGFDTDSLVPRQIDAFIRHDVETLVALLLAHDAVHGRDGRADRAGPRRGRALALASA
jgi:RNA polymerase sigma-70 factor (ECF subfamily)